MMTLQWADDTHRAILRFDESGAVTTIPALPGNRIYDDLLASGAAIADSPGPPPPTAADVRAEASRRMQAAFGARDATHLDIIIANATREVARLNQIKVGVPHPVEGWLVEPRDWTADERVRLAALHGADAMLEAIRAASNVMEGNPPADYQDNTHWPY